MCKGYGSLNRYVFSLDLNIGIVLKDLMWPGSSFHNSINVPSASRGVGPRHGRVKTDPLLTAQLVKPFLILLGVRAEF